MIKKIFLFVSAITIVSCGNNTTTEDTNSSQPAKDTAKPKIISQPDNELADFEFHTLVLNIPSPFATVGLLSKAGLAFNSSLTNPTS